MFSTSILTRHRENTSNYTINKNTYIHNNIYITRHSKAIKAKVTTKTNTFIRNLPNI